MVRFFRALKTGDKVLAEEMAASFPGLSVRVGPLGVLRLDYRVPDSVLKELKPKKPKRGPKGIVGGRP